MLNIDFKELLSENKNDFKQAVEYCGNKLLDGLSVSTLVVRASKYGSMVLLKTREVHWIPAYWSWWDSKDQAHVIDVTGAGNAFCGGFAYGWIKTQGDAVESSYYGAVSASYTVEQMGTPSFTNGCWNDGPQPMERLKRLKDKSCKFY